MKKLSILISSLNDWFWSRLVASTYLDIKSVALFRVLAGLFLLLFNNPTFGWIGKAPQAFFRPPLLSLANCFHSFPGVFFFQIIDILLLVSAVCITVGVKARISSWIYILLSVIALSFQFSFGKIDHNILILCMLACMSFSGWGTLLALVPDKEVSSATRAKSYSLLAAILCFAFFSAGFDKAINWINLDFNKNGTGSWYYSGFYTLNRHYFLASYMKYIPFWGFKIMDFLAVPFELSSLLFVLHSRKGWSLWLLVASLFHFINLLILNIPFIYISIVYIAFVDFSGVYSSILILLKKKAFKIVSWIAIATVIAVRIYYIINLKLSTIIFVQDFEVRINLFIGLFIWLSAVVVLVVNVVRCRKLPAANVVSAYKLQNI